MRSEIFAREEKTCTPRFMGGTWFVYSHYTYANLWRNARYYDESDTALSETMQAYWVNFVKTGNPNGKGLPEWQAFNEDRNRVIAFDTQVKMCENPYRELYPIIDKYQNSLAQ